MRPTIFFMTAGGPASHRDDRARPGVELRRPVHPRLEPEDEEALQRRQPRSSRRSRQRGSGAGKLDISADVVTIQSRQGPSRAAVHRTAPRASSPRAPTARSRAAANARPTPTSRCRSSARPPPIRLSATLARPRTVTFSGRSLKDYCKNPRPGPAGGGSAAPARAADAAGASQAAPTAPRAPSLGRDPGPARLVRAARSTPRSRSLRPQTAPPAAASPRSPPTATTGSRSGSAGSPASGTTRSQPAARTRPSCVDGPLGTLRQPVPVAGLAGGQRLRRDHLHQRWASVRVLVRPDLERCRRRRGQHDPGRGRHLHLSGRLSQDRP